MIKSSNKSCTCENYSALELSRDEISKRIKESKKIIKHLEIKSKAKKGNHLYQCEFCQQLWQLSNAWNWGGKNYLFKVPKTKIEDWNENPFMHPADMLIFSAAMQTYEEKHKLTDSEKKCRRENCNQNAILADVLCKKHW
ncbi:MAG: hypothetical protein ACI8VT_002585 [Saprospiraceae bacterium]|jgi:hypothetical protein